MSRATIIRTHNGGPTIERVDTAPDMLLEIAEPHEREPHWTDPAPRRNGHMPGRRAPLRGLLTAVLLVAACVAGVLLWP